MNNTYPSIKSKGKLSYHAFAVAFLLLASACARKQAPVVSAPTPVAVVIPDVPKATPGLTPAQRIKKVITVAARGDYAIARLEIDAYLIEKPSSEIGQSLKKQLDTEPRVYLGTKNFPYTLKAGESLATVAERFMGDRYRFIGLARYNNISVPERAQAGQIILVPGSPPVKMPDDRSVNDDNEIENRLAQEGSPKPTAAPPENKPKLPTVAEISRAGALRQSALEQLQRGFADRAAILLEEALKLYPTSAKILRDLDRARRLQALTRKPIK